MENEKTGFLPRGAQQWARLGIGMCGIIIFLLNINDIINFNFMVSLMGVVSFIGYAIDGLLKSVDERKKGYGKEFEYSKVIEVIELKDTKEVNRLLGTKEYILLDTRVEDKLSNKTLPGKPKMTSRFIYCIGKIK